MLADGLPDISISHRSAWGLPVPVDGYSDQRLYVWFEMAAGYIAATQDLAAGSPERNELEVAWSTTQSKIVQFFGMDNGYFHVVLFPAIYMAMGNVANIPKFALTNEFLRLDGSKFSTSRSHAIWARDFLKQQPSDLVRYYLALAGPETSQTDFTVEAYSAEVERIRSSWRRWLSDLDAVVARSFGGCVPDLGLWLADHRAFLDELCGLHQSALAAYEHETFSPSRAVRCARELVHACGRFADGQRRLETIASLSAEWRTAVALQLAAARSLATIVAPVMPGFSANLRASLGCDGSGEPIETQPGFVQAGIQLGQLAAAVP